MRKSLLKGLLLALMSGCLPTAAFPISPTLYFHSDADESSSRAALHARVSPEVQALSFAPVRSLPEELDRCESLIAALQKHAAFLKIRTLEDTQDQPAKKARDEVDTDQSVLGAAMDDRLRGLSPREVNSLGRYVLLAQTAQRDAAHALPPDAEQYRGAVIPPSLNSFADAYDRIQAHLTCPEEVGAADTTTRRKALAAWNEAYDKAAPEEATLLAAIVELENRDAMANGYKNAADRKYQARGLSDALVTQTLAAVQVEAPAYRHYQEVLAQHAAGTLGVSPASRQRWT
jgi:oligoendopeptidase F